MAREIIEWDQGWDCIQKGITKLKRILEEQPEEQLSSEEYLEIWTTIYTMCTQKRPHDYSQQLYNKYREAFEEYITSTVLPSLREKHDEFMLRELDKRWSNHKVMVRWLSRFFHYLDRYFIARRSLPALNEVGLTCFRDQVYNEIKDKVRDAVIILKVQHELLEVFANQPLEKQISACRALLTDDKVDDLSRMYRLYHKIPKGLELIANTFKQHVTNEGTDLFQQAEDAASNQATTSSGAPGQVLIRKIIELHDKYMAYVTDCFSNNTLFHKALKEAYEVLIRKIIELHDKYMAYVTDCFSNNTLFHKALKEAFEVFCNKTVAGGSSAELLATFCDNILKKGGSEKLGDEAIEETLEKVVKLLAYISDKDLFAEFYWKKLARRLLFDRSANDDHERSILTKLKQQCGGQFTSKMEGMVSSLHILCFITYL
ncbi:hypothetical protein SLEP1_g1253 [Rubroshorea leprosula]|uniref:Cullin family profile domain-containing protein n=1 Tax=Rubroshorea leprosula TaxID=152421 RepID=A0AAV5HLZ7_9ROSI|nr:hypothetical protein SLEP1_g1253 [Rubroshorea leprosula]